MLRVVPAEEHAVRDVEVARARVVRKHAHADLLEPAALDRQSFRAGDELRARPDRDVGVPERDALEVVVVGGLDVEEIEVAAPVDDDLAVARRLDHDRLLGRAVGGQVIGPFERGGGVDGGLVGVELVAIRVGAGVDQDHVARLDARPSARRGVAGAAVIVVGAHDAGERRFGLRARVADRIDVIDLAALGRPRLGTRAHGHRPGRIARPGRSRRPDRSARSAPRRRCRARGRGCCRRTCSARRDRTRSAA